jgi:hypothetical protein
MFFKIFFSFLQICFLPGFIAYTLINRKTTGSRLMMTPVFSFGLSLIINYLIVFFLAYFHIYTRIALVILLITEFIIIAVIFVFHGISTEAYSFRKTFSEISDDISFFLKNQKSTYDIIRYILLILSVLLLITLINVLVSDTGKIFDSSDAVFSWNRWATDFFNNKLPVSTYHYPQLIPANWSIWYVICGYPFQFIPKMIMHLFLILPVYSLIVSGIKQKSAFWFLSAYFMYLGLKGDGFFWTDGMVDVAVAYFATMVFISLSSLKKEEQETDKIEYIILGAIFACGAAVTKQAGIFVIAIFPVILYVLSVNKFEWTYRKILKMSLSYLILLIVIVLPYYFWAHTEILKNNSSSEISYTTQSIFNGATYTARFSRACGIFYGLFSNGILFILCFIFFLISFTNKTIRLLNLVFVIPYFFIWSLFFSYSIRNAAIIVPFFALGIGTGMDLILKRLDKKIEIPGKIIPSVPKWIIIFLIIAAGIYVVNKKITNERLKESQEFRLKLLGDAEVNQKLYIYNTENPINKLIITDYHYLKLLPDIGKYFKYNDLQNIDPQIFTDESVGYMLWSSWYTDPQKFPEFIESGIKSGLYKEIFNHNGFRFIKIR